jgi:molybdopterin converting factor small subunit
MQVTVKLFATFRDGRFKVENRDYPEGAKVADILRSLEIEEAEIGMLFNKGRHVEVDHKLGEGDVIGIFPLVGGG